MKKQSKSNTRSRSTSRIANKQHHRNNSRILSADHIADYTSSDLIPESEGETDGKIKEKKYSKQKQEHGDYSDKDDKVHDKLATMTLKKTFTSMLSKLPFADNKAETSSVKENGRSKSETSGHSTLDRATYQKRQMKKGSGNLGRAHSASSVNLQHKGTRVLNTSKEIDH